MPGGAASACVAGTDVDGYIAAGGDGFEEGGGFGGYRHWRQVGFAGVFEGGLVDELKDG